VGITKRRVLTPQEVRHRDALFCVMRGLAMLYWADPKYGEREWPELVGAPFDRYAVGLELGQVIKELDGLVTRGDITVARGVELSQSDLKALLATGRPPYVGTDVEPASEADRAAMRTLAGKYGNAALPPGPEQAAAFGQAISSGAIAENVPEDAEERL
jgi:hypothetical protein